VGKIRTREAPSPQCPPSGFQTSSNRTHGRDVCPPQLHKRCEDPAQAHGYGRIKPTVGFHSVTIRQARFKVNTILTRRVIIETINAYFQARSNQDQADAPAEGRPELDLAGHQEDPVWRHPREAPHTCHGNWARQWRFRANWFVHSNSEHDFFY